LLLFEAPNLNEPSPRRPTLGLDRTGRLASVIRRLSVARSIVDIQRIVSSAARRLNGADGGTFVWRDGDDCFYAEEDAVAPLWKGRRFPIEAGICGWVIHNGRAVALDDVYADERVMAAAFRGTFVRSMAMVPIRQGDPIGAIGTYWSRYHHASDEEMEILHALADSAGVAIENARVYEQLEESRAETMRCLALAAEYRDDGTHEHTERVATTAKAIAHELGLTGETVELIHQAAPLHDLGKLAIPDVILLKPGRLTTAEFEQVKQHTTIGASILSGSASDVLQLAEEIALSHHEWWNGRGYPLRLKGEAIPLSGRIVAIADVFDALSHARPYKSAWSVGNATDEITRLSGIQFDPAVVAAFTRSREKITAPAG
jgi:putative two-component system response regulator